MLKLQKPTRNNLFIKQHQTNMYGKITVEIANDFSKPIMLFMSIN